MQPWGAMGRAPTCGAPQPPLSSPPYIGGNPQALLLLGLPFKWNPRWSRTPSWTRTHPSGSARAGLGRPTWAPAGQGLVPPSPGPSRTFLLEPSETFHKIPEPSRPFRNNSITFQYMNLILRTIPDLLVMSRISSETPNKLRSPKLLSDNFPYLLRASPNFKRVSLRFANNADMIETPLRSITNSGVWIPVKVPTSFNDN